MDKFDRILIKQATMSVEKPDFAGQQAVSSYQPPISVSAQNIISAEKPRVYQEILNDPGQFATAHHPPFIRQIYLPPPSKPSDDLNEHEKYKMEIDQRIAERDSFTKEFIRQNSFYRDPDAEALYKIQHAKERIHQPNDTISSSVLITTHPDTIVKLPVKKNS